MLHPATRLLGRTTGDGNDLAVDPATVIRSQESHNTSNVFGDGAALQWAVLGHELLDLVRRPVWSPAWNVVPSVLREHVGLDATRRNTVDGDAPRTEVGSKGLDHANDGHLGGIVQAMILDAKQAGSNGAHEDQTPVVLEVLPRRLADEELRTRVEVEDMVELLFRDVLGLVPALGGAVAHDDIDLAEVLLRLLEQPLDLADLADVRLDGDGFGPGLGVFDLLDNLVGAGLGVGVVYHDAAATLAQLDGAASSDAAAGAGDDGDFVVQGGWCRSVTGSASVLDT